MDRRFVFAVAALVCVLLPTAHAQDSAALRSCSGGNRAGKECRSQLECPMGTCVLALGVCDGGSDDGFRCPCPGSVCSSATPCSTDPAAGTCAAGPAAGECCSLTFGCTDGKPCVASVRVCDGGRYRGSPCLRDAHCPEAHCTMTAKVCEGGIHIGRSCADNADCPRSTCGSGLTAPSCVGDCNGSGDVTVDELVTMVNIALGNGSLAGCPASDGDRDNQVTVDEILKGVNHGLTGCPAGGGPTSTR